MGSIVSHIHDLIEEYGTWENYELMLDKKRRKHELKTLPIYYQQVISGQKRFEYRRNDRCYQVGDVLILREYILPDLEHSTGGYTGQSYQVVVTSLLKCSDIDPGNEFVVLQISPYS